MGADALIREFPSFPKCVVLLIGNLEEAFVGVVECRVAVGDDYLIKFYPVHLFLKFGGNRHFQKKNLVEIGISRKKIWWKIQI